MFITVSLCKLCKERSTCGAKQAIGEGKGGKGGKAASVARVNLSCKNVRCGRKKTKEKNPTPPKHHCR